MNRLSLRANFKGFSVRFIVNFTVVKMFVFRGHFTCQFPSEILIFYVKLLFFCCFHFFHFFFAFFTFFHVLLFIFSLMFISFLSSSYQRPNYIKNVSHFLDLQNIRIQRNTLHQITKTRADHASFLVQHIKQL